MQGSFRSDAGKPCGQTGSNAPSITVTASSDRTSRTPYSVGCCRPCGDASGYGISYVPFPSNHLRNSRVTIGSTNANRGASASPTRMNPWMRVLPKASGSPVRPTASAS